MKIFLSILVILSVESTWAQHEVGNGGNAVVCYRDSSKREVVSVRLFDYWEQERLFPQYRLDMASNGTVEEHLRNITHRLGEYDWYRAETYRDNAVKVLNDIDQYLTDSELPMINDDHSPVTPVSPCFKEQFAVQLKNPPEGRPRFQVSKKFWNHLKLSNLDRAGILLHEMIYREEIGLGQTDSDRVRPFIFIIASTALDRATLKTYNQFLTRAGIKRSTEGFEVDGGYGKTLLQLTNLAPLRDRQGNDLGIGFVGLIPYKMDKVFREGDIRIKLRKTGNFINQVAITQKSNGEYRLLAVRQQGFDGNQVIFEYLKNGRMIATLNASRNDDFFFFEEDHSFNEAKILTGRIPFKVQNRIVECGVGKLTLTENGNLKGCTLVPGQRFRVFGKEVKVREVTFRNENQVNHVYVDEDEFSVRLPGCSQTLNLVRSPYSHFIAFAVSERDELDLKETSDWSQHFRTMVKDPIQFKFDGKVYSERDLSYFKIDRCEMKFTFSILVGEWRHHPLAVSDPEEDTKVLADHFCKEVGLDGLNRKNEYDFRVKATSATEFFTQIYELDTKKLIDLAVGKPYTSIVFPCHKTVAKSL